MNRRKWLAIGHAVLAGMLWGANPAGGAEGTGLGLEPGDHRLQNDDVGVILWGPEARPTLSVGKSDVWDRRLPPSARPVLTLAKIVEMAHSDDPAMLKGPGAAYYSAYNSYDFPCPKPVGQLILQLDFMTPDGTLTVDRNSRRSLLVATKGEKQVKLVIFVSAIRNLIVIRGEAKGLDAGDMAIRLYRHRDTIVPGGELHPTIGGKRSPKDFEQLGMPKAGQDEDVFWISQDFPGERTFPGGFTCVLAAEVSGAAVDYEVTEGQVGLGTAMVTEKEGRLSHGITKRFTPINESPGSASTARFGRLNGAFQLMASVVTTQDDPDPLGRAKRELSQAKAMGEPSLWAKHVQQLDAYDDRPHARAWSAESGTILDAVWGGVAHRVRPGGFYGDVPLCSVDSTKFCFQDSSRWHADFHFNEVEATSSHILRQFDSLNSYFRMIHGLLPMAQANAREVYDCTGAMYPLVHYPLRAETVIHTHATWEQSMEITALLAKPFWLRFLYTWDKSFLRELAYPVLREGARFYADFLRRGEDGMFHVFPTVSPEHRGITKDLEFNRDSQSGITLIRYHLRAAAEGARMLNVDSEEAARWREIADHMPGYPTVDTPEGEIYVDVAGAKPIEYNIAVPLSAVFWGDDIGLDSPPEVLALMHRTLRLINVWKPHRSYLDRVRTRLGVSDGAGRLSPENFLQSYTGRIRVFPAVGEDFEGGFENFGAQGGFVVSATRGRGGVKSVKLTSLAGNACALARPWGAGRIDVQDVDTNDPVIFRAGDGLIRFETIQDHTYLVTGSGKDGGEASGSRK